MISDIYSDETAESLHSLGYEAGFIQNLVGGEEIALMHKEFEDGETQEIINFYSVVPGTVFKTHCGEGSYVVRFVAKSDKGVTKPMSLGGAWGIYIRK